MSKSESVAWKSVIELQRQLDALNARKNWMVWLAFGIGAVFGYVLGVAAR